MPEGAMSVTRPGRFGNPFVAEELGISVVATVELFRQYALLRLQEHPDWLEPLRGRDLACWCPTYANACHASVLLELANLEVPFDSFDHDC